MLPHLRDVTVMGPSQVTGVSETPSRVKIFTCRPTSASEEESCAADILKKLTARAYRGAPTAADLQDAMKFYEQGRGKGGFEAGIRMAVQSILMSPRFLFRLEEQTAPAARRRRTASRMTTWRRACRSSCGAPAPDAELVKAAGLGALRTPLGLEKQVAPHAGGPPLRGAGHPLRLAVAAAAGPRQDPPRLPALPAVRRHAGRGA